MYNMDISIFGYKLNLEILILIGIIYLILVGHMFCGCCNFGMMEGFDSATNMPPKSPMTKEEKLKIKKNIKTNLATQTASGTNPAMLLGPSASTGKEGFTGANINYGESSLFDLSSDKDVDTSSWSAQNMTVVPGQPLSKGVKDFLARPKQQIPLPEGEMFMFANTKFAPECCPNTYSNGSGCACMTGDQYNYLVERSGNNVPYSEY